MLEAWVIDQIKKRQEQARREQEEQRARLDIPLVPPSHERIPDLSSDEDALNWTKWY